MLRLLLALCVIGMIGPLAACDDDPDVVTTSPGQGAVIVDDDD